MREALMTVAGWVPLWALALISRWPLRPGRILLGAGLAGFVGGMCCVELRRHGLVAEASGSIPLFVFGLRLEEVLRFALIGAAGALLSDRMIDAATGERVRSPRS